VDGVDLAASLPRSSDSNVDQPLSSRLDVLNFHSNKVRKDTIVSHSKYSGLSTL
jgi:hypothetical protein